MLLLSNVFTRVSFSRNISSKRLHRIWAILLPNSDPDVQHPSPTLENREAPFISRVKFDETSTKNSKQKKQI